ncbi:hypothetical protein LVB87_11550 [Lysobacter sp. KIS68-7]|uniref:hypothetical protein n=1 Tax=Lysobacter sp. KIS68-7 TaxID=2904252 RepID=UPI001E47AAA6|nr:hypothetical protein [Lysobacter sp. KIS68-7]UHQ18816.1 hypothetical protein LVB87_11550 [Lysobacter sp. KIS68-7]
MEWTLDYELDIRLDLRNPKLLHSHFIEAQLHGIEHLAEHVREEEQHFIDATEQSDGREPMEDFAYFYPVTYCTFNWFAISLTNYLRLVALVDLVNRTSWSIPDLVENEGVVNKTCRDYVEEIVPAVVQWRNKVAAHPAATAPIGINDKRREADRLGTLLQSFSCPVVRTAGYLEVARIRWQIDGETADLLPWSVTAIYEHLTPRFWPDKSLRPHRHKPGKEPKDEPGTYLRQARCAN